MDIEDREITYRCRKGDTERRRREARKMLDMAKDLKRINSKEGER